MEFIINKNDTKWNKTSWLNNKWYSYEIHLNPVIHHNLTLRDVDIFFEHNVDTERPDYYFYDDNTLIIKSIKKMDMKVTLIKRSDDNMENKEDFIKIITEELERKRQQRKDYEHDIIKLKQEVNRLMDIEIYLMNLRDSVISGDFRENGDKLILNCKHKKY